MQLSSFIKVYLEDIVKLNDLPKNNSKILHAFLKRLSYDGVIVINTYVKN